MSFSEATLTVLQEAGEPLHYREITSRAIGRGLVQTDSKTPEAALNATLSVDIKQKGEASQFIRIKPGVFGLRTWGIEQKLPVLKLSSAASEDQRVRIPHFPLYSEVRLVLPIGNIQRPVVDALRGSLHRFDAVRGTIITTGDFSKGTTAAVERGAAPITLINGEKLIDLLIEHKIGVRQRAVEILELDADVFAQQNDGGDI